MTTQMFKAKDVRSAISMVTEEFGDDAIILSTKKNNGFVEIEASNNNEVITSFPRAREDKKTFSKIFYKKLDKKTYHFPEKNNLNENKKKLFKFNQNNEFIKKSYDDDFASLKDEISSLKH